MINRIYKISIHTPHNQDTPEQSLRQPANDFYSEIFIQLKIEPKPIVWKNQAINNEQLFLLLSVGL